jgi:hypothetical protein
MPLFTFSNILKYQILFFVVTEFLGCFMPTRSPFGYYGGFTYINSLRRENDEQRFNQFIAEAADNIHVSFGCDKARERFEQEGGMEALRRRTLADFKAAYQRSQTAWPLLLMLCGLGLAAPYFKVPGKDG